MTDTTPEVAFAAALAAFWSELPKVGKGQTANTPTYSYSYADLADISEKAAPLLAKHGLSFIATPTVTEDGFVLRYALLHRDGHREGGDYPLPDPAKSSPQQIGSALTYGRRYCLCAVTGIAPQGDDDDGAKAADARSSLPRAPRARNATVRTKADAIDPSVPDEWTTRVTDTEWMEDFRRRLTACGKPSEVRGLQAEANVIWAEHRLTAEDAKTLKSEVDMRLEELTGELVP